MERLSKKMLDRKFFEAKKDILSKKKSKYSRRIVDSDYWIELTPFGSILMEIHYWDQENPEAMYTYTTVL